MKSKFSKLNDISQVVDSLHKTPKYSDTGRAMVRCTDVKYGKLDLSKTFKVSDDVFTEFSRRYTPKREDIIITRVGSYGITAIVEDTDFCLGQNTSVIIPKINPRYLYLALNSTYVGNQIDSLVVGSTQKTLSLKAINNLDIPRFIPEVEDKIATIVGDLDDKIEINNQINQTLESMAQAIFKSWFVDFDPVKAKIAVLESGENAEGVTRAAMRAISGKTHDELDKMEGGQPEDYAKLKTTAELFPAAMQDSELGGVPEGWTPSSVGAKFNATMGQSPPGDTYNENEEGKPFFQGRRDFGWRYPENRVYCTQPNRMAKKGDTLLSVRAPVGDINKAVSDCCIGRGIAALRHKSGCEAYTYYSMMDLSRNFKSFNSEGTVFGSINQKDLKALKVVNPSNIIIEAFTHTVGIIDQHILILDNQVRVLANLRDTLLPKLMSGVILVKAER